jgi:hypothetical protein
VDGKTRVRMALNHQEPDRVPLYEGAFSSRIASEILGREAYIPSNGGASFRHFLRASMAGLDASRAAAVESGKAAIELCQQLGLDMIRVRITDFLTPLDFGYGNYGANWPFETEIEEIGENHWRISGPEGFWSEHLFEPETDAIMCVDHSIHQKGIDEYRRFVDWLERQSTTLPSQAEPGLAGVRAAVDAAREAGVFVVGWGDVVYPGSSPYVTLFLIAMATEPELIHRYMEITTEGALTFVRAQIEQGVDGILGGNDWCFKSGPMFSLKFFREFFVPHLRRIVEECHAHGVPYIKHLDGNTTLLLDSLVHEVGIDAYHAIEPPAGMDIVKLKQQYGSQITLMGNLDCGELLTNGTPRQIEEETRRIIRHVSPGGGHVFGSSNSIHDAVPLENLYAMLDSAHHYGRYPIQA